MAKRTRAPARQSRTGKSPPTKVRKLNAERTKKAVEARRCKFSPVKASRINRDLLNIRRQRADIVHTRRAD